MIRLHKKALDCCGSMHEEVLVKVCLHGIVDEYCVYLEKFVLPLIFQTDGGYEADERVR